MVLFCLSQIHSHTDSVSSDALEERLSKCVYLSSFRKEAWLHTQRYCARLIRLWWPRKVGCSVYPYTFRAAHIVFPALGSGLSRLGRRRQRTPCIFPRRRTSIASWAAPSWSKEVSRRTSWTPRTLFAWTPARNWMSSWSSYEMAKAKS